jgi:hypothetical protein
VADLDRPFDTAETPALRGTSILFGEDSAAPHRDKSWI